MEMEASSANERLHFGKMGYGCQHYRRRCKIRAPCCDEVFSCRHCHNEAASMLSNPFDRHELVRQDIKQVICLVCDTEQPVAQVFSNCGVNMGEYFCEICNFFDDDTEKEQFHCHDCGICRMILESELVVEKTFFTARSVGLAIRLLCEIIIYALENSMRHHCPICYEIEATVMPEDYRHKKVWILCNDCNDTTEVYFHIIGQKCSHSLMHQTEVEMKFCSVSLEKRVNCKYKTITYIVTIITGFSSFCRVGHNLDQVRQFQSRTKRVWRKLNWDFKTRKKALWQHNVYGLTPSIASAHHLLFYAKVHNDAKLIVEVMQLLKKNDLPLQAGNADIIFK
ncbi:hypothetical protein DITRI_Ditri08aG0018400 [Diplodiscus trichospermus]